MVRKLVGSLQSMNRFSSLQLVSARFIGTGQDPADFMPDNILDHGAGMLRVHVRVHEGQHFKT